jgi:hypothetical protein
MSPRPRRATSPLPEPVRAELVELLARLVVSARRRRLLERTDPLGGTTVAGGTVKPDAPIRMGVGPVSRQGGPDHDDPRA